MRQLKLKITGTTTLLMHNPRTVNPLDEYAIRIREKTTKASGKNTVTEDQRLDLFREKFLAAIYADESGPIVPATWIRKSVMEAARKEKQGKNIENGLFILVTHVPLIFDGPRNPKDLWKDPRFVDIRDVGMNRKRVPGVRPRFDDWSIEIAVEYDPKILDEANLRRYFVAAGIYHGIGDGRTIGMGRFDVTYH